MSFFSSRQTSFSVCIWPSSYSISHGCCESCDKHTRTKTVTESSLPISVYLKILPLITWYIQEITDQNMRRILFALVSFSYFNTIPLRWKINETKKERERNNRNSFVGKFHFSNLLCLFPFRGRTFVKKKW